jgi:hypothetical protein
MLNLGLIALCRLPQEHQRVCLFRCCALSQGISTCLTEAIVWASRQELLVTPQTGPLLL